jgi:hypothetical protein
MRQTLGGLARKPDRILEALQRVMNELRSKPASILFIGDAEGFDGKWRYAYSFTRNPGRFSVAVTSLRRHDIEHPLAIGWYPSVQIHQMGKLLRHGLRNRGYYYPSVAMTDEHHVFQVLIFDYPENVLHVRVQSGHTTE